MHPDPSWESYAAHVADEAAGWEWCPGLDEAEGALSTNELEALAGERPALPGYARACLLGVGPDAEETPVVTVPVDADPAIERTRRFCLLEEPSQSPRDWGVTVTPWLQQGGGGPAITLNEGPDNCLVFRGWRFDLSVEQPLGRGERVRVTFKRAAPPTPEAAPPAG